MLTSKPKKGDLVLVVETRLGSDVFTLPVESIGNTNITVIHNSRKVKFNLEGRGNEYFELWGNKELYQQYCDRNALCSKINRFFTHINLAKFSTVKLRRICEVLDSDD